MHAKDVATDIVKKLVRGGYKAYFAGGWVRDYLMNHPSDDIDIATDAPPQVILDLFPHTILVGMAFGVVVVVMGGYQFEVSTFRRDIDYINGRKPESIELSNAQEDAIRRDFTINGMFYDPLEDKIYDYVQGMEDIKKGIIRTIGDPFERFFEDRLRMIRAIRFSARFGFPIDLDTQQAIQENAETLFPAVAMERVWNEFAKMSKFPRFEHALIDMHRLGLLPVIFSELKTVHLNDIKHYVRIFPDFPKETPTIVYVAELFPHYEGKQLVDLCQYLRISTRESKSLSFIRESKKILSEEKPVSDTDWVQFYAEPHASLALDIFAAHLAPEEKITFHDKHLRNTQRLEKHVQRLMEKKPLVTADMLKSLGIPQGKMMGLLLKTAEEIAISNDLNEAAPVIALLRQSARWHGNPLNP
jgi:poly(A) polymerase